MRRTTHRACQPRVSGGRGPNPHASAAVLGGTIHVLILDDSSTMRELIRERLLAHPFYECREASTARAADGKVRSTSVRTILVSPISGATSSPCYGDTARK
ncbi:MAG: hypothetical protein GF331_16085 [Chitinivibrionales bacterium]|nr:hypothetical protein [Chitinivibrionales bacterium]